MMTPSRIYPAGPPPRKSNKGLLVMIAAMIFVQLCAAACASKRPTLLEKRGKATYYDLSPINVATEGLPALSSPLAVTEPHAEGPMTSDFVLVEVDDNEMRPLAATRWVTRVPLRLHGLLIDAFEGSGLVPLVERDPTLSRTGYHLRTELRDMRAVIRSGRDPVVRLRLVSRLHRVPSGDLVAAADFEESATPVSSETVAIMKAFDSAVSTIQQDVVDWTLRAAAADEAKHTAEARQRSVLADE